MASKVATQDAPAKDPSRALETVLIEGDLSVLSPDERVHYYRSVCESLGLNPLTKPFEYIKLNGKFVLYARRDCAEQLRKINRISVRLGDARTIEGVYVISAHATDAHGREDASTGAVALTYTSTDRDGITTTGPLKGEGLANAFMKAETKAKRRVTLSICGLGMLDETEIPLEASTRQATRPAVSRKPADDLADFAGTNDKPAAEPPPPVVDSFDPDTGEVAGDADERPHAIKLETKDGAPDWAAFCSDMKDALLTAEDEDTLLAIMEQNAMTLGTLTLGGKGGRAAGDRLRGVFTSQQIELRRRAAAA